MIGIEPQALEADPKAIKKINFTGNLDQASGATVFFIIEGRETVLNFSKGNCESIKNVFHNSILFY